MTSELKKVEIAGWTLGNEKGVFGKVDIVGSAITVVMETREEALRMGIERHKAWACGAITHDEYIRIGALPVPVYREVKE